MGTANSIKLKLGAKGSTKQNYTFINSHAKGSRGKGKREFLYWSYPKAKRNLYNKWLQGMQKTEKLLPTNLLLVLL